MWAEMDLNHRPPGLTTPGALTLSYRPVRGNYFTVGIDDRCRRSASFLAGTTPMAIRDPW
jgi:hypothetical protein